MTISERDIEKALHYLRESVEVAALAKSSMVLTEQLIKTTKARLQANSKAASVAAAEIEALCHPDYKTAVEAYAGAVEAFEAHKMRREAAIAWVDAWRSQEASNRANDRAHR